jgi:glycosyltransferase involved in cell wall biosynthesis
MVGRLVPVKNHEMAVRVCDRVIRQGRSPDPLRLVIVGDGPRRDELERQVQDAGLQSRIAFEGWRSDLPKVYAGLDLALLTSCNEGTPVALIEAMAAGLPFIATRVGGVCDLMVGEARPVLGSAGRPLYWIYDNGILVDSDDVDGCAAAVTDLAADPDRMRWMGEAGREFVRKRYSKERLLEDMRVLYDGLVHGKSSSGF